MSFSKEHNVIIVFWVSSGLVAAVRKDIMKFIQYAIYWEKTHTQKILDKINVTKNTSFSKKLQPLSQYSF